MFTFALDVVLFPSRTVIVYDPADRFVAVRPVCAGLVLQLIVNGGTPPTSSIVAEPLVAPWQLASLQVTRRANTGTAGGAGAGSVMVNVLLAVHPFASVTV
jgi:hypothetical protein